MLILPVPPSVNHYWVRTRKGFRLSDAARTYKALVGFHCRALELTPTDKPVRLFIDVYRPAKRGDIDNYSKCALDSLKGWLYHDDAQVVELHMRRYDDKFNPRVEVTCTAVTDRPLPEWARDE